MQLKYRQIYESGEMLTQEQVDAIIEDELRGFMEIWDAVWRHDVVEIIDEKIRTPELEQRIKNFNEQMRSVDKERIRESYKESLTATWYPKIKQDKDFVI